MSNKNNFYANLSKYVYPLYSLVHPIDGFNEMKNNKKYSMLCANIVLFLWVLLAIVKWQYVDFDFQSLGHLKHPVDLLQILLTTIVVFAASVVSNWCFCTLMDGKGRLKEIWISSAYALIPYVVLGFISVGLSHVLVMEEAVYVTYINYIGLIWTALLLILEVSVVHDYTIPQTIACLFLTFVGVFIILFLMILLSGLYTQVATFIATIYNELSFRFS